MSKNRHCKYCGCKTTNQKDMCNTCIEKLRLIRKIRAIVFMIKQDSERKSSHDNKRKDNSHS